MTTDRAPHDEAYAVLASVFRSYGSLHPSIPAGEALALLKKAGLVLSWRVPAPEAPEADRYGDILHHFEGSITASHCARCLQVRSSSLHWVARPASKDSEEADR